MTVEADAENDLRSAVLRFMEDVRAAERAARRESATPGPISADDWRRCWPRG